MAIVSYSTGTKKIMVAVLVGWPSSGYEVSLNTGRNILSALDKDKYPVPPVVVTEERKRLTPPPTARTTTPRTAVAAPYGKVLFSRSRK